MAEVSIEHQHPILIYRHRRENLKKCSLRGLESNPNFKFLTYPKDSLPNLDHYILLDISAPPLTITDCYKGLFILDATWRYAATMLNQIQPQIKTMIRRSIPSFISTAYPRRQEDCPNPKTGLASVEALYTACAIMGWTTENLLDHYYWKNEFLEMNKVFFKELKTSTIDFNKN